VQPYTESQIELVENFAAQAVIAIENARLLNELRESLQQQTATADVLKVISRSTFDLHTVLDTLVESAAQLCEADTAAITRQSGEKWQQVASHGYSQEFNEFMARHPIPSGSGSISGRVVLEGRAVQVADVQTDPEYEFKEGAKFGGLHTMLGVPLLREGSPIGVIALSRTSVRPFTDKQIELVETFADQAVIAIENVRLFEAEQQRTRDLTESLEQQTATAEVLRLISLSPGALAPVFDTILAKAMQLCDAHLGFIWRIEHGTFLPAAERGVPPAFADYLRTQWPYRPPPSTGTYQMWATKATVQVHDYRENRGYIEGNPMSRAFVDQGGARTALFVPMVSEGEVIGTIVIYRPEVRPFREKQIALLETFADQAVIAIENARLLNELRQRTDDLSQRTADLSESLEQQTAISEILRVISNSPSDVQPVLDSVAAPPAFARHRLSISPSSITRCSGWPRRSASSGGCLLENRCHWTAPR